jgi:hypothetical protein
MKPRPAQNNWSDDPLFELELQVARRADELARQTPTGHSAVRDRQTWREAERECLALQVVGRVAE